MTVFLDAHILLWALFAPDRLSSRASSLVAEAGNTLLSNEASLAELLNKCGRGKLPIAGSSVQHLHQDILGFGAHQQPILQADIVTAAELPHHHSDPFDRLLIAQAISRNLPIVTADSMFHLYNVATIW